MILNSRFNRSYLRNTLVGIPLGILALAGVTSLKTSAILATIIVTVVFSLIGVLGYLCWLRRITILPDGLETRRVLLPFWKRFYRFAEFDYSEMSSTRSGDVLRLIKDGRRVVSIPSSLYENFEQLCQGIAVKGKEQFLFRDTAEVVSEYNSFRIYGIGGFFGLMSCLMALMPLSQYWGGREVAWGMILFALLGTLFIGALFVGALFPCQRITVWRGQISVRRLLWPFHVKHYQLSDFDGCYYVVVKANGQLGSKDEEQRWLTKNGKAILIIEESVYRNYEDLKNATRTNFLGRLELTNVQAMKYSLGKKIQL